MSNQWEPKPISWRKTKGTFHLRRKKDGTEEEITAGQTFLALPEEVPVAFRDTIKPVVPTELQASLNPPLSLANHEYKVVAGKGPGRFNVVDGHGKVMNEKELTATAASELLTNLGG